ncbi:ATP-binding protein [bacterium]|nr:ATP-binding protein [bacterium]
MQRSQKKYLIKDLDKKLVFLTGPRQVGKTWLAQDIENQVAISLQKHVFALNDYYGKPYSLNYLRTKDGVEVDFCLVNRFEPELMIEVKRSESKPGRSLLNFQKRYGIPAIQLVLHLRQEKKDKNIETRKGAEFLKGLIL